MTLVVTKAFKTRLRRFSPGMEVEPAELDSHLTVADHTRLGHFAGNDAPAAAPQDPPTAAKAPVKKRAPKRA